MTSHRTQSSSLPLVRSAFGEPFRVTLEKMGYPLERTLRQLGIPVLVQTSPTVLMPERPWWLLASRAAEDEAVPDLGLRIGDSVPFTHIRSLAPQLSACTTLRELLLTFCRIAPLQSSHCRFDMVEKGRSVWLRDIGPALIEDRKAALQLRLYRLLGMIQIVRIACGQDWQPRYVTLPAPYNRAVSGSEILTVDRILFDQPHSAIEIPLARLDDVLPETTDGTRAQLGLESIPGEFTAALRAAIAFHLPHAALDVDTAAEVCGMSTRTLQRKLADAGTSFKVLLERTRYLKAREFLSQSEVELNEIADLLGYSDYTKFSRAFNRWTGRTPRQFRLGEPA